MRATGAARLHLVGFSTGALACYAWLSDPHRTVEVASLVSIGGAATFKRARQARSRAALDPHVRWLRHRWLMRVLAPMSGYWHPSPLQIIHNPENTRRRHAATGDGQHDRQLLAQRAAAVLATGSCNDAFRSIDQRRDYRAELPRITVPALFLAGPRDVLAPPDAVKDTLRRRRRRPTSSS